MAVAVVAVAVAVVAVMAMVAVAAVVSSDVGALAWLSGWWASAVLGQLGTVSYAACPRQSVCTLPRDVTVMAVWSAAVRSCIGSRPSQSMYVWL